VRRPVALITGASGGIGAAFATVFAQSGYDLVLVARSEEPMKRLASDLRAYGAVTQTIAMDLTPADAAERLAAEVATRGVIVDALVNNAGYATYGLFAETPLAEQLGEIALNVATLTALTHRFLPQMRARKHGYILNVASTAAFLPGPYMAVYYATKAFVLSFSEALATELEGTGVSVTCLCPGATASGFQERAKMTDAPIMQMAMPSAADVARFGYDAMIAGKTVAIHGGTNAVVPLLTRILPRFVLPKIVRRVQAPKA
jgi:short-subunit dehydrogenase